MNDNECSRRKFLKKCGQTAVAAGGLSAALNSPLSAADVATYKPVPNWPTLPKDFEMIGVNGISSDSRGRVYAAGGEKDPIVVFDADGKFINAWGGDVVKSKHELRIFNDLVYVADTKLHQMYEFTTDGKLLRAFGTRGKAGLGKNEFNMPTDLAFAPNGDIYVADGYGNSRIVCLKPDGTFKFTWGKPGNGPGEFKYPHNIVIDDQATVYVADRGNDRIQVFTPEGRFLKEWKNVGKPYGLYLTPDKRLFVTDGNPDGPHRVLVLDLDGHIKDSFGEKGTGPGQFDVPHSVRVDKDNNVFVAEVGNKRIQKFVKR